MVWCNKAFECEGNWEVFDRYYAAYVYPCCGRITRLLGSITANMDTSGLYYINYYNYCYGGNGTDYTMVVTKKTEHS